MFERLLLFGVFVFITKGTRLRNVNVHTYVTNVEISFRISKSKNLYFCDTVYICPRLDFEDI